jgi:hypothetical protein
MLRPPVPEVGACGWGVRVWRVPLVGAVGWGEVGLVGCAGRRGVGGLLGGAGVAGSQPRAFVPVDGPPFAIIGPSGLPASYPYSVVFDRGGALLATANKRNTVSVFRVAGGPTLTPVAGSPFALSGPCGLNATGTYSVAFSPDDAPLATANHYGKE